MALLVLTIPDLQVETGVTPGDRSQDTHSARLLRTNGHTHLPYQPPPTPALVRINISKLEEGHRKNSLSDICTKSYFLSLFHLSLKPYAIMYIFT